jgi:RNA polymerase sigma-70 factor (ECF subfamily)
MATADEDARTTALALAAGNGDRRALEAFIRATQSDVWRFVAHLTEISRADDLTQETYLRALGSLARFEGRSSARTWLLSIARRVVVDQVRTAVARPRIAHNVDWVAAADRRTAGGNSSAELAETKSLLAGLSEDRREAFVLTQILGLTYAEVAQICGCPIGTVRSRVARARDELITALRPEDTERRRISGD